MLDRSMYGRQDSNLYGRLGAGKLAKVWCPVAPKATAYADFATPALINNSLSQTCLSGLGVAKIRLHPSRGFHAAAIGAPDRAARIRPVFSLDQGLNNLLRARDSSIVELIALGLFNASRENIIGLVGGHKAVQAFNGNPGELRRPFQQRACDRGLILERLISIEDRQQRVRSAGLSV